MAKSFQVAHYAVCVDKARYPKEPKSFYKTRTRSHKTNHGPELFDVQVRFSELDKSIASAWHEKTLVEIVEDGDGIDLKLTERGDSKEKNIRLNYSQALEISLALNKWHQLQGSGMMREVKIKR